MQHANRNECIDAVADFWEQTKLADVWLVCQWHIDEYKRLQLNRTSCEFPLADMLECVVMLAKTAAQEMGHDEEYVANFENSLRSFLQSTIGRPPAPSPLPMAKGFLRSRFPARFPEQNNQFEEDNHE